MLFFFLKKGQLVVLSIFSVEVVKTEIVFIFFHTHQNVSKDLIRQNNQRDDITL